MVIALYTYKDKSPGMPGSCGTQSTDQNLQEIQDGDHGRQKPLQTRTTAGRDETG